MKHTRETVLAALRATPASDFTVLERTRSAFGDNYSAAYVEWRANPLGPHPLSIGGGCHASHAQLDAMAEVLNRAQAPAETPRPSVDEPMRMAATVPQCESFRGGDRGLRCIFDAGHVGGHLAHSGVKWGGGEPSFVGPCSCGRDLSVSGFVGANGPQCECGQKLVTVDVFDALARATAQKAAPVDPYDAFAINALNTAGRGEYGSVGETTRAGAEAHARLRLNDARRAHTNLGESIAELEAVLAEHGRKAVTS
jgi:hypothetical protein